MTLIETLIGIFIIAVIGMAFQSTAPQFCNSLGHINSKHQHLQSAINTIEEAKAGITTSPTLIMTPLSPSLTKYTVYVSETQTLDYIKAL